MRGIVEVTFSEPVVIPQNWDLYDFTILNVFITPDESRED